MKNYVIAHDLGTTGNKATLYDREGKLIGSAFQAEQGAILIKKPTCDRLGVALLGKAGRIGQARIRIFGCHELNRPATCIPAQIQRAGKLIGQRARCRAFWSGRDRAGRPSDQAQNEQR